MRRLCVYIPCGLAVRKQHEMLFADGKFEKPNTENQTVDPRRVRTKSAVFFCPQNQKRRSITMTKPKTLDQLRAEKERAETQLLQEQHKLERR